MPTPQVSLGDCTAYVEVKVSEWGRAHAIARQIRTVSNPFFTHFVGCKKTHFVLRPSFYLWSSEATKWVGI
jgi:hypothetical protein